MRQIDFINSILPFCDNEKISREDSAENILEIANNHAIGFALWIGQESHFNPTNTVDEWMAIMGDREIVTKTTSELLDLYNNTNQK